MSVILLAMIPFIVLTAILYLAVVLYVILNQSHYKEWLEKDLFRKKED